MDNDTKKFLSDLLAELQRIDYVRPEDIPNIDLYMDQITTFMDSQLEASKRHADDKILIGTKQGERKAERFALTSECARRSTCCEHLVKSPLAMNLV